MANNFDAQWAALNAKSYQRWIKMMMEEATGPDFYETFGLTRPEPPPWENDYVI